MEKVILSVSELTGYIKNLVETNEMLKAVWVTGEIGNYKTHLSGHIYFTLKDDHSRLKCVMFRGFGQKLKFQPEDGLRVIAFGSVGIYEKNGEYQLYVEIMEPHGLGSLFAAFEQLKKKLAAEGLFDEKHKKTLPSYPQKIALITSPTGAAVRDMIRIIRQRNPGVHIIIVPALVQGEEAPYSLCSALNALKYVPGVDLAIIGRGGGSLEELWAFNDERVVRAIFACAIPIISAIGHETDFTLADLVSDVRAPTPSAAAACAVRDIAEVRKKMSLYQDRLNMAMHKIIELKKSAVSRWYERSVFKHPDLLWRQKQQIIDEYEIALFNAFRFFLNRRREELGILAGKLAALNPLATLSRGYCICQNEKQETIYSSRQLSVGEYLKLLLEKGRVFCRVEKLSHQEEVAGCAEK
ncbi:MAG: exodeoxyribonuclease VII large subunit [Bacillota bacterium]